MLAGLSTFFDLASHIPGSQFLSFFIDWFPNLRTTIILVGVYHHPKRTKHFWGGTG